jgi:hypothetical protein
MTSIAKFLTSARYKAKLDKIIDVTRAFLADPDKEMRLSKEGKKPDSVMLNQFKVFDDYARYKETDDFSAIEYQLKRNMSIASVTATGGEIPSTSAGQLIKVEGGAIKITLEHDYDEKTQIKMWEFSQMTNIPQAFVEMLFGSVNDLQPKIFKTANMLMAQVWSTGRINFTDPRTRAAIEIVYKTYPELFPDPLTGNALWTNATTADGIGDLQRHSEAFYYRNGFYPKETRMSKKLCTALLKQESTANYAISQGLISAAPVPGRPTRVSLKILNEMAKDMNIPPIVEWDAQYEIEVAPGETQRSRYINDNIYTFLSDGMSERLFVPTIESALGTGKPKPGVFLKIDEIEKTSPPKSRTYGVARIVPWVDDTRLLAAAKVA